MFFAAAALSTAILCIQRLEDEGSVNIYPVHAQIDGDAPWLRFNDLYYSQKKPQHLLALKGGEERCLSVEAGVHVVSAGWPHFDWSWPDHGASGDSFLISKAMTLELKSGETAKLQICSKRDAAQVPEWNVYRKGDTAECK